MGQSSSTEKKDNYVRISDVEDLIPQHASHIMNMTYLYNPYTDGKYLLFGEYHLYTGEYDNIQTYQDIFLNIYDKYIQYSNRRTHIYLEDVDNGVSRDRFNKFQNIPNTFYGDDFRSSLILAIEFYMSDVCSFEDYWNNKDLLGKMIILNRFMFDLLVREFDSPNEHITMTKNIINALNEFFSGYFIIADTYDENLFAGKDSLTTDEYKLFLSNKISGDISNLTYLLSQEKNSPGGHINVEGRNRVKRYFNSIKMTSIYEEKYIDEFIYNSYIIAVNEQKYFETENKVVTTAHSHEEFKSRINMYDVNYKKVEIHKNFTGEPAKYGDTDIIRMEQLIVRSMIRQIMHTFGIFTNWFYDLYHILQFHYTQPEVAFSFCGAGHVQNIIALLNNLNYRVVYGVENVPLEHIRYVNRIPVMNREYLTSCISRFMYNSIYYSFYSYQELSAFLGYGTSVEDIRLFKNVIKNKFNFEPPDRYDEFLDKIRGSRLTIPPKQSYISPSYIRGGNMHNDINNHIYEYCIEFGVVMMYYVPYIIIILLVIIMVLILYDHNDKKLKFKPLNNLLTFSITKQSSNKYV
jgi:hypothetical protein